MSKVSPRGPLPPRVYWRRRLLLLVVVVGVVALVGQLFTGGDAEPVADRSRPQPTTAASGDPAPPTAGRVSRRQAGQLRQPAGAPAAAGPGTALGGAAGPLAQPAGPCSPADVVVVPDVEDTHASGPVPLRLGLSTRGAQACTFAFAPDSVALRVTSGDDLVWESLHCASAIEQQSVVVRPGWLSYVTVDWSGRRSSEGCAESGDFAAPGYYWAEAAAIGGEPERTQFVLRTPPPPEPTEKPSPGPGATPSEQPSGQASSQPSDRAGDADTQQPSDSEPERSTEPERERSTEESTRQSTQQSNEPGDADRRSDADRHANEQQDRDRPVRTRRAGG